MKIVLIDKFGKVETEWRDNSGLEEPPTCAIFYNNSYIYRANRSNDKRWTYQVVSTVVCRA